MKYLRYHFLEATGRIPNRVTANRWIERGTFPPPYDLGPNSRAWSDEDIAEFDERARKGITEPNPKWLARLAERKASQAQRDQAA